MERKKFTDSLHVREYGFRNQGNFSCKIRNPGLWNPEYSLRNPECFEFD